MQATDSVYLSDLSPRDQVWDTQRSQADRFKILYRGTEYDCYAARIAQCSCRLVFAFQIDDTGICRLKLAMAHFCHCRWCPVCQGRRSLVWRAKMFKVLPQILHDYPKARFLFLTLTVKNCQIDQLRSTLAWMHNSWHRLVKRKEFVAVDGWIRAVEVTRGKDNTAHPHYHCILMVKPSYFTGDRYVAHDRWRQVWQECLGVDYSPQVDIRAVRSKRAGADNQQQAIMSALVETLKYSVKPSDVIKAPQNITTATDGAQHYSDRAWLLQLTEELHKTRAIATGGVLKRYLKMLEEEPENLIHVNEDGFTESDPEGPQMVFGWRERMKRYQMEPEL